MIFFHHYRKCPKTSCVEQRYRETFRPVWPIVRWLLRTLCLRSMLRFVHMRQGLAKKRLRSHCFVEVTATCHCFYTKSHVAETDQEKCFLTNNEHSHQVFTLSFYSHRFYPKVSFKWICYSRLVFFWNDLSQGQNSMPQQRNHPHLIIPSLIIQRKSALFSQRCNLPRAAVKKKKSFKKIMTFKLGNFLNHYHPIIKY